MWSRLQDSSVVFGRFQLYQLCSAVTQQVRTTVIVVTE